MDILLISWGATMFLHILEWFMYIDKGHEKAFALKKGGLTFIIAWTLFRLKGWL